MSGLSPARRLRSKTSDLGDFFRSSGHHTRQNEGFPPSPSTDALQVPESSNAPAKKRVSRIPFLGRSRKKSNVSDPNDPRDSEAHERMNNSVDVTYFPQPDDQSSISLNSPVEDPHHSSFMPAHASQPTFGSKFAAHFAPSKQQKSRLLQISPRKSTSSRPDASTSDTLFPPNSSPRSPSFDSSLSGTSQEDTRSTTPRPLQPTITVSPSPDVPEEDDDLFTKPRPRRKSALKMANGVKYTSGVQSEPESERRSHFTEKSSPRSSNAPFPRPSVERSSPTYPSDAESVSRASDTPSFRSARKYVAMQVDTDTPPDSAIESDSTPRRETHSPRVHSDRRKTLGSIPSRASGRRGSSASAAWVSDNPTKPPDIPLPATPDSTPPLSPLPILLPPSRKSSFSDYHRQRASTLSSVSSHQTRGASLISPQRGKSSHFRQQSADVPTETDTEIESASHEQLRAALRTRKQQVDDLIAYVSRLNETHATEKADLESKISNLEQEATRREKEIKGLTWLVKHRGSSSSVSGSISDSASKSMSSLATTTEESVSPRTPTPSSRLPQYLRLNADDSGAESYSQTSGAESTSSSIRGKKVRRKIREPRTMPSSSSLKHSVNAGLDVPVPEMPSLMKSSSKRASMSSMTSSVSASTISTIPPPTPTPNSLTAIPETPPLPPLKSIRDPAIAAALQSAERLREKEREERRATAAGRSLNRLSAPNLVAPAPTPAAAYAANLRRGRPPSIAQVLERNTSGREEPL